MYDLKSLLESIDEKKNEKWDKRFLELAFHIASWSKDRSRKVGCIIVGPDREIRATGYNGFPRGINDDVDERHERPAKYLYTSHAELNSVCNAARAGVSTLNCTAYVSLYPCADCAKTLIQSGITKLITIEPDFNDPNYVESFKVTDTILKEAVMNINFSYKYIKLEE